MDRKQTSHMMSGVLMIVLGLIFLAGQLRLAPELNVSRLWPLIVIVFGVGKLVLPDADDRRHQGRFGGIWFVFVGAIFLLNNFHVMTLSQSWPLFIVAGGVTILMGRGADSEARVPRKDDQHGG